QGAVPARRARLRWVARRGAEHALLDGRIVRQETDRLDSHLDLAPGMFLEVLGERLLDGGPAAEDLARLVGVLGALGPERRHGLGVAAVERLGERFRRLEDGFTVRLGCLIIFGRVRGLRAGRWRPAIPGQ